MKFSSQLCLKAGIFMTLSFCTVLNAEYRSANQQIARGESFGREGVEGGYRGDEGHSFLQNPGRNDLNHSNEFNHPNATRDEAYRYGENRGYQQGVENSGGYVGNPIYVAPPVQYAPNGNPYTPSGNDNWGQ